MVATNQFLFRHLSRNNEFIKGRGVDDRPRSSAGLERNPRDQKSTWRKSALHLNLIDGSRVSEKFSHSGGYIGLSQIRFHAETSRAPQWAMKRKRKNALHATPWRFMPHRERFLFLSIPTGVASLQSVAPESYFGAEVDGAWLADWDVEGLAVVLASHEQNRRRVQSPEPSLTVIRHPTVNHHALRTDRRLPVLLLLLVRPG